MPPKDADEMVNTDDPDLGLNCLLSFQNLGVITVYCILNSKWIYSANEILRLFSSIHILLKI